MGAVAPDLTTDHVPVRDVLSRVHIELRRSTAAIERLEEAISDLLFDKDRRQDQLHAELQNIDLVRQEIAGLADFLVHLVPEIEVRELVDIAPACAAVTLHALVTRLRACNSDDPVDVDDSDGHEWFRV